MVQLPSRRVEAGFKMVGAYRHIERNWERYRDPAYWLEINPELTITDCPVRARQDPLPGLTDEAVDRAITQLDQSGFLATPGVVSEERMAPIRRAMDRLDARGLSTVYACLYDEYYHLFEGMAPLFNPILGDGYRWVAHGYWAFKIPAGDEAVSWLSGPSGPHRDTLGPDAGVMAGEHPHILTVWIALSDVTTADSCIYVAPKYADKGYASGAREVEPGHFPLQAVRAVPVEAGGILAWSTHLAHWGGRSTPEATAPRYSATMYFQRGDVDPLDESIFDAHTPATLDDRLRWVITSMGGHDLIKRLPW
jgi:hypothetical protein